jgi:hypothetical protein
MRHLSCVLPLLLLAACSAKEPEAPVATASASGVPVVTAAAIATAAAATARAVKEENDLYEFEYGYPAAAAAIAPLREWLDADLTEQRATLARESRTERDEAKKDNFEYRAHSQSFDWKVVTETPHWLSLSTLVGSYTGGAHPNYYFATLVWDKDRAQRLEPVALFTSKEALSRAIRKDFCAQLNRQREKKRGEPVNADSTDEFDACIDPVGETVILGSTNRQQFNRIGVLVAPYEAGPYAEGDYEVTLPVTAAVLAAVKPEYRGSFSVK